MTKNRQARRAKAARQRRAANHQPAASQPMGQAPSPSPGQRAARSLDGHAPLRDALAQIADQRGEWAGIPMPLDHQRLVIEPTYPWAKALSAIGDDPGSDDAEGWTFINQWYCRRWRCDIIIMRSPDGKIVHGKRLAFHHISQELQTIGASEAWGLDQEQRALQLLGTLISHRAMKQYVLTGAFIETSKRSGLTYIFRRLRPTVAIRPGRTPQDSMRVLCALCMHPIAYYADSWAGAMCPTDDVVAHLMLMRGDEPMFWRRANQHPPYRPEAGL